MLFWLVSAVCIPVKRSIHFLMRTSQKFRSRKYLKIIHYHNFGLVNLANFFLYPLFSGQNFLHYPYSHSHDKIWILEIHFPNSYLWFSWKLSKLAKTSSKQFLNEFEKYFKKKIHSTRQNGKGRYTAKKMTNLLRNNSSTWNYLPDSSPEIILYISFK